jgi:hypothetical protein
MNYDYDYAELEDDIQAFAYELVKVNKDKLHLVVLMNRILKGIKSNVIVTEENFK